MRFGNLEIVGQSLRDHKNDHQQQRVQKSTLRGGRTKRLHEREGVEESEKRAPCVHEEEKTRMKGRKGLVRSTIVQKGNYHAPLALLVPRGIIRDFEYYDSIVLESAKN